MSMQSIVKSSFDLTYLNEKSYEIDVHFWNVAGCVVSKKSAVFTQVQSVTSGETWDVYSQNGVCCDPILNLFKDKYACLFKHADERGIKKAADYRKGLSQISGVLVLDMKDQNKKYLDKMTISKSEEVVSNFLKTKKVNADFLPRAKKLHAVFQESLPIAFVLCEGSLKCDILHNFSDVESDYFLNTAQGRVDFCQVAEFYMNGFKFGQEARGIFSEKYFLSTSSCSTSFKPQSKSTVWYPEAYKEVYSLDGPFATVMKPFFSVFGDFDAKSGITSMTLEVKK